MEGNNIHILTEEERKMIRKGKVYKRTTQDNIKLYYQKLLNCLEELDAAFEGGYEDMEMEELHGHVIREIRRVEDILEIPHTHIELDPVIDELFAEAIMKEINSDPALRDVQAPAELRDKVFKQIEENEKGK